MTHQALMVGFTGTHLGMSSEQELAILSYLENAPVAMFHHGDCIGADAQAAALAVQADVPVIVRHPPIKTEDRAFFPLRSHDIDNKPKPYLERDRDIVQACEVLLATPRTFIHEKCRHGTCYTVRYAWREHRRVVIFNRDGGSQVYRP